MAAPQIDLSHRGGPAGGSPSGCTVCDGHELWTALDFGPQPPSNRFVRADVLDEERHKLSVGACEMCGTVQLVDRMPIEAIRPRYQWLANSEPEGHLDRVVDNLLTLPGINADSHFLGLSYKDRSTLARLTERGFANAGELDYRKLLNLIEPFGLETIQRTLADPQSMSGLLGAGRRADVVVARHIVEHAESASRFLSGVRGLLRSDGYLVVELPDSARLLRSDCHAFVWEEHFTYFTEASFRGLAARMGADVVRLDRYRYRYEDALVGILRFAASRDKRPASGEVKHDVLDFAARFEPSRAGWHGILSAYLDAGHKLAVFGAGHLAVKLINFMALAPWIECVIDDHPQKVGLHMPGSMLPIVPSTAIAARGIDVCISTLSPESEARVCHRLHDFFRRGGRFVPAFDMQEDQWRD